MKKLNGNIQMKSLWEYWAEKNPFRHPATKQPVVLEYVLLAGSNEGDLVLDPFAGSGTTGFVAQGLRRKCLMVEIDKNYCQLIKERIEGDMVNSEERQKLKEKFRSQLLKYVDKFNEAVSTEDRDWVVKGFIDIAKIFIQFLLIQKSFLKLWDCFCSPKSASLQKKVAIKWFCARNRTIILILLFLTNITTNSRLT